MLLLSKIRTAAKTHKCDYCNCTIKKDETYSWSKIFQDGNLFEWHACFKCKDYVKKCFQANYCDCQSEGLSHQTFVNFMNENHHAVAKEWW